MQEPNVVQEGNQTIWHDATVLPAITALFFDLDWQRGQDHILGVAKGRGKAHFLHIDGLDLVLRPYLRGGLVGRVNRDRFLRTGAARSRAFREFTLLSWMREQGLTVPRPVAAHYAPSGVFYRAALVTQTIPQARPLADILHTDALPHQTWTAIGTVIRQMHDLGVDHTDLNCRNILLDGAMDPWLIDFDKCSRRAPGPWKGQNLARLERSLVKERGKLPALAWTDADWTALQKGYGVP